MTEGQLWLVILILLVVVGFIGLPWWAGRRRPPAGFNPIPSYLAAIDALIHGRRGRAMEALRRLARHESENLPLYLRLGDLVRIMGHPDKAQRIHSGLLARPVEDPELARQVRQSLLEDQMVQRKWEEAVHSAEGLLASDRKNRSALRALAGAWEAQEDWERAFSALDEWHRHDPKHAHPHPAQLRAFVAQLHLEAGRTREARRILEEAAKADGGSSSQVELLMGDLWAREGDHAKAVEQWLGLAGRDPERAGMIFERLERSYFELGRFGELLQVYERLREQSPASVPLTIALAEMHRRRGQADEAVVLLESLLAGKPRSRRARRLLVSCLLQLRRLESAAREMDQLLQEIPAGDEETPCPQCGYRASDLWLRCPDCGAWPAWPLPAASSGKG